MYKILAGKPSMESAMKLRDAIQKILGMSGKEILVSSNSKNCQDDVVLLRYGCSYGNLPNEPEWSSIPFFNVSIDKKLFSEEFREVADVPFFERVAVPQEFPVLIRETLTGARSEGIHLIHNLEEFNSTWKPEFFWTKYYEHEIELRIYVVLSEKEMSLRIYRKVPRDSVPRGEDFVCGLNGEDNTVWVLKSPSVNPLAVKTVQRLAPKMWSLGGRFAAFDMIYSPEERRYIVLEMNSGPWLSQPCAEWLAEFYVKAQGEKYFDILKKKGI